MPDGHQPSLVSIRQLPVALEAEQRLLGALLTNNRACDRCSWLRADQFAESAHARIYEAITRRVAAGKLADAITLRAEFENDPDIGAPYLAALLAGMVTLHHVEPYAEAIRDAWLRREAITRAQALTEAAFVSSAEQSAHAVIAEAVEGLLGLDTGDVASAVTMEQALGGAVTRAEAAHRGDKGQGRLDTGVRTFDSLWGGLWPGHLYYLSARSRTGKTPAALMIARNVAQQLLNEHIATGLPVEHVHVVSLEMMAEDLGVVQLAQSTRWTADQIRAGDIGGPTDWLDLERARTDLSDLPIIIDAPAGMTLAELSARTRIVRRTRRTRLVIIDYRELIRPDKAQARMSKPEWIPYVGGQLKGLAKALGVPLIALTQINKSRDKETSTRPTLGDLPYDGGQDADAVFFLYRPEIDMDNECPDFTDKGSEEHQAKLRSAWWARRNSVRNVAEFGALKRRFGPTGWKKMKFDGPRMLFVDPPDPDEPPPYDPEDMH